MLHQNDFCEHVTLFGEILRFFSAGAAAEGYNWIGRLYYRAIIKLIARGAAARKLIAGYSGPAAEYENFYDDWPLLWVYVRGGEYFIEPKLEVPILHNIIYFFGKSLCGLFSAVRISGDFAKFRIENPTTRLNTNSSMYIARGQRKQGKSIAASV